MSNLAKDNARIQELIKLKDRTGCKPLNTEQRVQLLNEIYDGLLYWWRELIIAGATKGTGAVSYQLERARLELQSITGQHSKIPAGKFEVMFKNPPKSMIVRTDDDDNQ